MDGFIKVKKKERRKHLSEEYDESTPAYFEKLYRRVGVALEQFQDDPQLSEAVCCFDNALALLGPDVKIQRIVCYGLGSISNSKNSLYQFAMIHHLSLKCGCSPSFYDPVFSSADFKLFEKMQCSVLPEDDGGRRKLDCATLFFTPHSPRRITNNILSTNWGPNLSKCVIFGDDFLKIILNTPSRFLKGKLPFLNESQHFVEVIPVENSFKYPDVFNDMAFHVFVPSKLAAIDPHTWGQNDFSSYRRFNGFVHHRL